MAIKDIKELDKAPDWSGHCFGERLGNCVMQLLLFGILTEEEAKNMYERLGKMWNKRWRQGDD